jgi:hypothetical protein
MVTGIKTWVPSRSNNHCVLRRQAIVKAKQTNLKDALDKTVK